MNLLNKITEGRTDLVFEFLAEGNPATFADADGVSLVQWCAYYGDVTAIKHLLANGAMLSALGTDFGLNGASFHGHWKLCQFLLDKALVLTVPGKEFGAEGHLRLSFAGDAADVAEGLKRIRWALDAHAPREIRMGSRLAVRDW